MKENKNTLFTIGRFAALHKINKKTLMWYDETGLLKPAVIKPNGYRCYTYFQSPVLEMILLLRSLGVSVPEIKTFIDDRSPERLKMLLKNTVSAVDYEIMRLSEVRRDLLNRIEDVDFLLSADLNEISMVEKGEERIIVLNTDKDAALEKETELVISETEKLSLAHFRDAVYGAMIHSEELYRGEFENYAALYIKTENGDKNKNARIKPAGRYLRAFHKGSWNGLPGKYKEILEYAKRHNIRLTGYSYETGLNDMLARSEEDYITQIEIAAAPF